MQWLQGSRIFGGTHGKQERTSNMGAALCKWKGDHGDMDALARETLTIDSEEENLYLNASRNGAMRQRSETHDRSAAQVHAVSFSCVTVKRKQSGD